MRIFTYLFAVAIIAVACAPKTSTVVEDTAKATMPNETVSAGRDLYSSKCSKCHKAKPIDKFSQEQWGNILPVMSQKAKLTEEEHVQVDAYVQWELAN